MSNLQLHDSQIPLQNLFLQLLGIVLEYSQLEKITTTNCPTEGI